MVLQFKSLLTEVIYQKVTTDLFLETHTINYCKITDKSIELITTEDNTEFCLTSTLSGAAWANRYALKHAMNINITHDGNKFQSPREYVLPA